MHALGSQFWTLCSCREPFLELVFRIVPRIVPALASAAMAACAALPDADMLTAINKQHAEQVAGPSFPCCRGCACFASEPGFSTVANRALPWLMAHGP